MKLTSILSLFLLLISFNTNAQVLELYSNDGKDEFIGCLTCDAKDSRSIWNHTGTYGNLHNKKSIWNKYGVFGDEKSNYSPWNIYGEKPPILKKDGQFKGYFTLNKTIPNRVESALTRMLYEYYLDIRENVPKWSESAVKVQKQELNDLAKNK